MKDTKQTVALVIMRISGALRALNRGDITDTEFKGVIARIVREAAADEARRSEA